MDNVNFHKTEAVQENLSMKSIYFDYIPPYSPNLNTIEEVFGMFKIVYYDLPAPKDFDDIADTGLFLNDYKIIT